MANELAALSSELAAAVEQAGKSVVAVHARPRFSSSGVFWKTGVIVTAEHAIRREDEITVTLPDGKNTPAVLVGSDPGTDLAVLKVDFEGAPVQPAKGAPVPGNLALAIGRSEAWVADRTGHKSSVKINRYRRAARTAAELGLGDMLPLVEVA